MGGERPNILLILSDQHHAGIMGCAGDGVVYTPALDRLASAGVRFSNAYCPFPLCGPSRMSFMTCRHPHEIGLWDNEGALHSEIPTFAHAFLQGGYDTLLAGRMHFVGQDQRHGFAQRLLGDVPESVYLCAGWKLGKVLGDLVDTPGMGLAGLTKSGPGRTGYHAYDEAVTRTTVQWLKRRGNGAAQKPFLLTVGYAAPHCPFVAPPADFERYAKVIGYDALPIPDRTPQHPVNAERRKRFQTDPSPPLDAQWRARVAYYGLCSFLDRQIETVIGALESAGMAGNTIVVYASDHGEMLGEHGMWWKSTFYDGASRVPLIVSWPGQIPGGGVSARNVSLMGIGTTLLELTGMEPLPGASGHSFAALLQGDGEGFDDMVFAEYAEKGSGAVSRMVRSGPWKYNYYHGMRPELFHLADDPGERQDLWESDACRDIGQRLQEHALRGWNADRIAEQVRRCAREQRLIANWVNATLPEEPDPLWFDGPLENWVNTGVTPPAHPRTDGARPGAT